MNRRLNSFPLRFVLSWMMGDGSAAAVDGLPADKPPVRPLRLILQIVALLLITGGSLWLAFNPAWVQEFNHWGYAGIFLISLVSSATVILPAPGLALVFALGAALNPVLLGVIAGVGSGLGELSGYVAGATGGQLIRSQGVGSRLHDLTSRYTAPVLFVLAILPLPIFDFAGILAGALRMPVLQFLGVVISGKIIKHILIAFVGAGSLQLLQTFFGF